MECKLESLVDQKTKLQLEIDELDLHVLMLVETCDLNDDKQGVLLRFLERFEDERFKIQKEAENNKNSQKGFELMDEANRIRLKSENLIERIDNLSCEIERINVDKTLAFSKLEDIESKLSSIEKEIFDTKNDHSMS
jgi:hypothetical protein